MTIIKDLQAISKELTKLVKQTEKLAAALEKAEKPKAKSVKTKTKAKAVITKKTPAKGGKKTDTDKLLAVINRSKKGVDTATLMKKTGFDQKKVRNMLNRTYKQGKITRVEKGIYVGVK
jgi:pantothenate kinase